MFVVVAYPTEEFLGIDTPNLSIKNREGFEPDFALHEGSKKILKKILRKFFFL